ncbi:MAG: YnbE family lipoprotein [Alphaproteobacteria bacterium]|nr:YnbE family lipoprotein [Alphaproteobacteria bacterium]
MRQDRTARQGAAAPLLGAALFGTGLLVSACQPTVKVQAPDKPIEINLNVNITQEVRVKIEREAEEAIAANPDLF